MEDLNNIQQAFSWYLDPSARSIEAQYCATRDQFEGRLTKLLTYCEKNTKLNVSETYLLNAVIGEIGANSYDHNLGHWNKTPGIHFGYNSTPNQILIWICDRGRGIHSSLTSVHGQIGTPQETLDLAFVKRISGRYPERRGNGLKFVRQSINCEKSRGLWCRSGDAELSFGLLADNVLDLRKPVSLFKDSCGGTFTIVIWKP